MTQFKDQSWNARFGAMGDEAEAKFEEVHEGGWVRHGLNRPPLSMSKLPPFVRYAPDYLTTSHGYVEVQGVGRDRLLKLKVEKAIELQRWHGLFMLTLFVWDSKKKRHTYVPWNEVWSTVPSMPVNVFPEGKAYWEINIDAPVWEWADAT